MAYTLDQYVFRGLSTDTKPTVDPAGRGALPTGARFIEINTGTIYDWNGSAWIAALYDTGISGGGGGAATIADGADTTQGAKADSAATTDTGTFSIVAFIKRGLQNWTTFLARVPALGQALAAASSPVVLPAAQITSLTAPVLAAGENFVGKVGGTTTVPSANFTRPADTTAYASGDLVANSTTAGSVTPMSFTVARVATGSGMVRRARLRKSGTSITNASFRLHLYTTSPTSANGDNGAWSTDQASTYLGAIDVTVDKAFTDGAAGNGVPNVGSEINFALASGSTVYGLLEARGAYTPISAEVMTLTLEILQN